MARQIQDNDKFTGIRLPTSVKPIHYDITLKPNLTDFTFQGELKIQYKSTETTKNIVLHSIDIVINEGTIKNDPNDIPLDAVYYSEGSETATLEFQNNVPTSGTIHLRFTGTLNDKLRGFYRTSFKIGKSTAHAATTHFEPTHAHRCFPCWDEPAIKATFSVSLIIKEFIELDGKKYECRALSNMNEISRSKDQGDVRVNFAKTPVMSTYLMAFIVGPFEAIERLDGSRTVRIFTTPGKKEQGQFALDVACKSLNFYEDYFGIKELLPKMDLIAIPDFPIGAMENWGLVTYRETLLVVDPNNTSAFVKQRVAIVIAHELAHQWFGNLVTMEWWTHLWLKEGFATFMSYLCVDHIFPDYDIWSQFVTDCYMQALELDSLHSSHPIEVPVKHPSEISEIFDAISYEKGSAVIRMLHRYVGDDSFRKGLNSYLTKFAYKNAITEDLWNALEAASGKPVQRLMSRWTLQKGYPWLSVDYLADGDQARLTVTQNKFTANGRIPDDEAHENWMIPIDVVSGNKPSEVQQLRPLEAKSDQLDIHNAGSAWIKLNPGAIGLYRVAYPNELMNRLLPAIEDQSLAPLDRLDVQCDYFALCMAGKVNSVQLLELLNCYKSETNYSVWSSIDCCLSRLEIVLHGTDSANLLKTFARQLYSQIFAKIGWSARPAEGHVDALTRALVINGLVRFGHEAVVGEALKRFSAHVDGTEPVPVDLRSAVYRAVSIHGNDEAFENLFTLYRSAEMHEEKDRISAALAYTSLGARLDKMIEFILSDELRNQDKPRVIARIGVSHPEAAWKLFQDKKEYLREQYGFGNLMRLLVETTTQNFSDEAMAVQIEKFFEKNKFPGCERTIQQSLETIRVNAEWLRRDGEKIKAFLGRN